MIGWIISGVLGVGAASVLASAEDRSNYMQELEKSKAGKTIVRTSNTSGEVFTFATQQEAIEHPQEVTFDPNEHAFNNRETMFLLNFKKMPIEVHNGKEFVTISDSELLTVESGDTKTYVYLRLKEEKIRR